MKTPAIQALEALAIAEAKRKYPGLPECHYTSTRKYKVNSANSLTTAVKDWINLNKGFAERINTGGIKRNIKGREMFTYSGCTKGSADLHSIINGKPVYIEIKWGADRQSQYQKDFQKKVEGCGAVYLIVRTFEEFYEWYTAKIKAGNEPASI